MVWCRASIRHPVRMVPIKDKSSSMSSSFSAKHSSSSFRGHGDHGPGEGHRAPRRVKFKVDPSSSVDAYCRPGGDPKLVTVTATNLLLIPVLSSNNYTYHSSPIFHELGISVSKDTEPREPACQVDSNNNP